ncbi:MAG TPA: hypothetical protein VFR69_14120, partial [Rubrobacteraceae bacterium]|nr:hypothetical protein [Rubrobacteraceae bacterium]
AEAEAALAEEGDPWAAFSTFMLRIVDADTHSLVLSLAGTFAPTHEMYQNGQRAEELNERVLERTKAAGALRYDVEAVDIALLFEQLAAVRVADEERTRQLRHRYLALILDALRNSSGSPLPGPPPSWEEIGRRWEP